MQVRKPWFATGFIAVLAIGAIIALGGGVPSGDPSPAPTTLTSSTLMPGQESAPVSIATPSMPPDASPDASADASSSSVPPTKPLATPTPGATLDWVNVGFAVGVKDPVALGGKAKVTITAPVGPICHLQARYPNGQNATVGVATHPKPGTWVWSWTVPGTAGLGQATVSFDCTYAGLAKPGTGSFDIVDALPTPTPQPTPTPTWSITGSVDSPVPVNGTLTFHGTVHGAPPPGISPIDLRCELYLDSDTIHYIATDGSVQTVDFTLAGPIGSLTSGTTHDWKVSCFPTAPGSRSVSGTFDVQ